MLVKKRVKSRFLALSPVLLLRFFTLSILVNVDFFVVFRFHKLVVFQSTKRHLLFEITNNLFEKDMRVLCLLRTSRTLSGSTSLAYRICFYFAPFLLLHSLHSIWQFSTVVTPPSAQGVIWSPSISSSSKCLPQWAQIPCWRS